MKRWVVRLAKAVLCSTVAYATGCSTVPQKGPSGSLEAEDRAEAMARYSEGLRLDLAGDHAAAFTNYLRAAELDPLLNEKIVLRVVSDLVDQGHRQEALALIKGAAQRDPKSFDTQIWLGLVAQTTGKPDDLKIAIAAFDRARAINPSSQDSYIQKAALFMRQKRFEEACEALEVGIPRVDDPLDLYRALGDFQQGWARTDIAAGKKPTWLPKAVERFEKVVAEHPGELDLREALGRLYILSGSIEKAVATYEPMAQTWSNDLRHCQQLAVSFLLAPDRQATLTALDRLVTEKPGNAYLLYYLGTALEQSNLPNEAAEAYRRAITSRPDWVPPYLRRVVLQVAANEPEEAILTLEDGLQVLPDETRFLELLAYLQLGRRDYDEAKAAFARAEKKMEEKRVNPVSFNFYFSQAFVYQITEDYPAAVGALDKTVKKFPDSLTTYVRFCLRSAHSNAVPGCIAVLKLMAESSEEKARIFFNLASVLSYAKQYPEAIKAFERSESAARKEDLKEFMLTPTFYFWYASACERNGEIERATKLFKRVLAQKPPADAGADFRSYVDTLNYLAYMWAERGIHLDQALVYVNEALDQLPDNPAFLDTRAWIYFKQGQIDRARTELQSALEIMPDDPTMTDHMGDIEKAFGQTDDAIAWWKKSLALDPSNESVARKLSDHGVDPEPLRKEAEASLKAKPTEQDAYGEVPDFGILDDEDMPEPDEPDLPQPIEP